MALQFTTEDVLKQFGKESKLISEDAVVESIDGSVASFINILETYTYEDFAETVGIFPEKFFYDLMAENDSDLLSKFQNQFLEFDSDYKYLDQENCKITYKQAYEMIIGAVDRVLEGALMQIRKEDLKFIDNMNISDKEKTQYLIDIIRLEKPDAKGKIETDYNKKKYKFADEVVKKMATMSFEDIKAGNVKEKKELGLKVKDPIFSAGFASSELIGDGLDTSNSEADYKEALQPLVTYLTATPKYIFGAGNEKMKKTGYTMVTGIPALIGVAYSESDKSFYKLKTCPGAGSCSIKCYARAGSFIKAPHTIKLLIQRFNFLLNNPDGFYKLAYKDITTFANKKGKENRIYLRWNDAGDFFDPKYAQLAKKLTEQLVSEGYNVRSYAYTKVASQYKTLKSKYFKITFSADADQDQLKDLGETKKIRSQFGSATIVPKKFFKEYMNVNDGGLMKFADMKDDSMEERIKSTKSGDGLKLKKAIAKEYEKLNYSNKSFLDSLKYTWELEDIPENEDVDDKEKYNAIYLPGDTDAPAQRFDVHHIFLLEH